MACNAFSTTDGPPRQCSIHHLLPGCHGGPRASEAVFVSSAAAAASPPTTLLRSSLVTGTGRSTPLRVSSSHGGSLLSTVQATPIVPRDAAPTAAVSPSIAPLGDEDHFARSGHRKGTLLYHPVHYPVHDGTTSESVPAAARWWHWGPRGLNERTNEWKENHCQDTSPREPFMFRSNYYLSRLP